MKPGRLTYTAGPRPACTHGARAHYVQGTKGAQLVKSQVISGRKSGLARFVEQFRSARQPLRGPILQHQLLPLRVPRAGLATLSWKRALSDFRFPRVPPSPPLAGQVLFAPRRGCSGKGGMGGWSALHVDSRPGVGPLAAPPVEILFDHKKE